MKKSVIYKITNPNGRVYIGQACDWNNRLSKYRKIKCKNQPIIYNSLLKYGFDSHIVEIIEECDKSELNSKEIFYIEQYKSNINRYPEINGMNCNDGGGSSYGFKHTEETKLKLRNINLGDKNPNSIKNNSGLIIRKKYKFSKPKGRKVIDLNTGIIYDSIKEASDKLNINYNSLKVYLNGFLPNKTTVIFF